MKHKIGRFMSFVLVLAMVLSMVPAALAAGSSATSPQTVYMAPGQKETFTYSIPTGSTVKESDLSWVCSDVDGTYISMKDNSTGSANTTREITANQATPTTGSTNTTMYVRVFKDATTAVNYKAGKTSGNSPLYTWQIKVVEWKVTLKASNDNRLKTGETKTLTATVTGPQGHLNGATVEFKTSDKDKIFFDDGKDKTTATISAAANATSGSVTVTLKAGANMGDAKITATVKKSGAGNSAGAAYNVDAKINESATATYTQASEGYDWSISLPQNEMTVKVDSKDNKLVPTATGVTGSIDYVYRYSEGSEWKESSDYLEIGQGGYIYAKKEAASGISVRVYREGFVGESSPHADITIYITNKQASSISIDYADSTVKTGMEYNGTHVLAVKDSGDSNQVTLAEGKINQYLVTSVNLNAEVSFGEGETADATDLSRVKWTIKNGTGKATFADGKTTCSSNSAKLIAKQAGTVEVTASIDGKTSDTMRFTIWQGREYSKDYTAPNISSPISNVTTARENFENQKFIITLTKLLTNNTVTRPMINVETKSLSNNTIQLKGTVDAFDTTNHIVYYPETKGKPTYTTGSLTLSSIEITSEPQDASYKLNATVGALSVTASAKDGLNLSSIAWYDNNGKLLKTEEKIGKQSYTSTLNLKNYVTTAGTYGFYAVIKDSNSGELSTRTALVTIGGDYIMKITANSTSTKPGSSVTLSAVAQRYDPSVSGSNKYVDMTSSYTVTWTVSDSSLATISGSGKSATLKAKSGGTVTVKASTSIDGKTYEGSQTITITLPTAESVQLMLEEDANYVLLDGSKISDAVKAATSTTPSTFSFTQPTGGTIYSSSALSSSITSGNKYSASDVSRMAFKPTSSAGSYTINYVAYGSDGQLASGSIVVMTNSGAVSYHISAGESQTMQVSDFRNVYGSGTLSYVVFGTVSDSRGTLYKGKTASSGKVGSESYYASSGTNLLSNVTFIAGSATAKYTVTIPFTAYGSSGTAYGNLVIYVNDTHSIYSTGATFKSMSIADEIAPESGASSAYVTIDSVIGGKLYSSYSSIKSGAALSSKDYGSTKFYLSGTNSVDNLYVLPIADSKTVEVNYTLNGSTKGTISFKVVQQTSSSKFTDMSGSSKWAANSVDFMYSNGLVNGVTATTFGPDQNMTRAMLVTILYRAAGEPTVTGIANKFTDNKENQYYYNAVLWASSQGIVNGASATTFDPDGKITREQIAAILYRYAGSPAVSSTALSGYSDQTQISSYAVTAMQWAVGTGIITGISTNGRTTLSAKNNATRAQVSVMLHRFLTF